MSTNNVRRRVAVLSVRWVARLWAGALFLFWGAFFVEHLAEWFSNAAQAPPARVVALISMHGVFLVGLLIGWRWELVGGVMALIAGVSFFMQAGGANGPFFSLVSVIPAIAWIGLAIDERLRRAPAAIQVVTP